MKHLNILGLVFAIAAFGSAASAQQRPPVRQLGAVTAKASEPLASIVMVRALSDGRVLVNDVLGRRVLLFDGALATSSLVADSTSATANAYAGRTAGLIGFRGDSSLFVDPQSSSMLVLDPAGKVARVMSVPRPRDAVMLATVQAGVPGFDPAGRLIYREVPNIRPTFGPNGPVMPDIPDSTSIIRVDLATRKVDTIGFAKIPKIKLNIERTDNNVRVTTLVNPLPVVDDWAVLPDGSVAFVRGSDYHVDWVNADGTKLSSPKVPFDWQRLTDADKVAFIDSVKAARARLVASQPAATGGAAAAGAAGGVAGGAPAGGRIQIIGGPGGGPGGGGGAGPGNGGGGGNFGFQPTFVEPSELPDYKPPFFAGSTRADLDGNLWVRTIPTKFIAGGPVYDVINRKGELVDRVQVPANTVISGFGPNGTVYLALTDNKTVYLEAAHVR